MTLPWPLFRGLGFLVVLGMAGVAAMGLYSIRKDVEDLRHISQDNMVWSATQMEVELLRFQRSLAVLASEGTPQALEAMRERFDILWSRVALMNEGRAGEVLRRYDSGTGTLLALAEHLERIDPIILALEPDDTETMRDLLRQMEAHQQDLRLYTLQVVRGETAESSAVRARILMSSQITVFIGLGAVLVSMLSLFLLMRESTRQKDMAEINRRHAEAAVAASRAKSRFLSMMSHELRNPLNGILGPLALLSQSHLVERQSRMVEQAQQSGRAMLRMLRGLLDYGDIQDDRLKLRREPFRPDVLAEQIREGLADLPTNGQPRVSVSVDPSTPELVWGDQERLRQIFLYLGECVIRPNVPQDIDLTFRHRGGNLVGEINIADAGGEVDWKLGLLMGMSDRSRPPFSTDALGSLIARGLLNAAKGVLALDEGREGMRIIRVIIPAEPVVFDKIKVHLETRSSALETLYRAALKSDRVEFLPPDGAGRADIVLVDTTSVGEGSLMGGLRARYPDALFVSLGPPESPGFFDDIVETPNDMARLRKSVLGRLAS